MAGFRIPTAWRWVLGRVRRSRSTTTRSATWAAVGSPSNSQYWARRDSSAAWPGKRGLYSQSWKFWAAQTGESQDFLLELAICVWHHRRQGEVGSLSLTSEWVGAPTIAPSLYSREPQSFFFSNICRNASRSSSWAVIFGSNCVTWTWVSGSATCRAVAVRSASSSCSVWPWLAARCSINCCWRILTSVSRWRISSMSGRSSRLAGETEKQKNWWDAGRLLVGVPPTNMPTFSTSVAGWKDHATRRAHFKSPEGGFYNWGWKVLVLLLAVVLSVVSRCGWIRAVLVAVLIG